MKRLVCLSVAALVLAVIPGFAAPPALDFGWGPQASLETIGTPREPGDGAAERRELQSRLAARQADRALRQEMVVRLSGTERKRIDDEPAESTGKYLVGVAKAAGWTVDFSPVRAGGEVDLAVGTARGSVRDGFVWTAAVRSPGATALRLHLSGVDLPAGDELYVYNLDGQAFGPYTGRGPLGDGVLFTNTVFGESLLIQLYHPGGTGRLPPPLHIEQIGVMGQRFVLPRYGPGGAFDVDNLAKASNLCEYNADCVVNAACQSSSAVTAAQDAVATMLFISGGGFFICTGGLIADTVTGSVIPYFLTAHHCIDTSAEAASLETYFDYQTTCGSPDCTQPYGSLGETVGATLLATGTAGDYSLLRLSSAPVTPDGIATYLGWQAAAVANSDGTALYRISHPKGAPQAYSEHAVDVDKPTCGSLPRGDFIYSADVVGATEGGSSGSPVVNAAGQIVGQLFGKCGFNPSDACDAPSNATVDGAFAAYFNSVSPFLDPLPLDFYTLTPCRLVDTRDPVGPNGGPALQPNSQRTFVLAGSCGVPLGAKALSVNLTVTQANAGGHLILFPADLDAPITSSINFGAGQTRANNAIVSLAFNGSGAIKVQNGSGGTVEFILDVNGYFQ